MLGVWSIMTLVVGAMGCLLAMNCQVNGLHTAQCELTRCL